MHDAETRALRRAILLLLLVSGLRWAWVQGGAPGGSGTDSILPALVEAVAVAASEEERRSRPLGAGELIDPNRADEVELDRLPGVGPSIAGAIVRAREAGAVFRSADDLEVVRGVGPTLAERIGPHLELRSPPGRPRASRGRVPGAEVVDINRAGLEALQTLPGVGPAIAERILQRRRERPFRAVDDLLEVRGIGPATLERLRSTAGVGRRR